MYALNENIYHQVVPIFGNTASSLLKSLSEYKNRKKSADFEEAKICSN